MESIKLDRQCNGCTACCEGWLTGEVYGHPFSPSNPCFYMTKGGCSIYKDRPEDPCKRFKCEWIENENYPAWLKPNESGVLTYTRNFTRGDSTVIKYRTVQEIRPISTDALFFFMIQYLKDQVPLRIQINGTWHVLGPGDFVEMFTR